MFYTYRFRFERYGDPPDLHVLTLSFPTRRPSDLAASRMARLNKNTWSARDSASACSKLISNCAAPLSWIRVSTSNSIASQKSYIRSRIGRSEEHTSELQSLMRISYAVFCLKRQTTIHNTPH